MSKITKIWTKIRRKWAKIRLKPIRVFCFHQVSEIFDDSTMKHGDWLQIDTFKRIILELKKCNYHFISLPEAREKLLHDVFRCKKYVVLTADDGWASLRNILPWLNEQKIPITLFLNPAYLDGKHYREKSTEIYLSEEEVRHLHELYPLITIGMHGWEHVDVFNETQQEFIDDIRRSANYFCNYPNFVPFFAYTWGHYMIRTDKWLIEQAITPVHIKGNYNYSLNSMIIDRELLDENIQY